MGEIVSHLVTAVLAGAVSALLAYFLARNRFRYQQWWQKRSDAYERIIDALHTVKNFSDVHLEAFSGRHEIPSDDELIELRKKSKEAHNFVLRAIDVGKLILPDEAIYRLHHYSMDIVTNRPTDWHAYLIKEYEITDQCIGDISRIARKDLGGTKRYLWSKRGRWG